MLNVENEREREREREREGDGESEERGDCFFLRCARFVNRVCVKSGGGKSQFRDESDQEERAIIERGFSFPSLLSTAR